MESLQESITNMMVMFNKRMAAFEKDLQKTPAPPSNITSLAAEFTSFRTFIVQSLQALQQQLECLAHSVDNMEMQRRRKILLIHGVKETPKEDINKVVTDLVCESFQLSTFSVSAISRSHRMGRSSTNKPRPILLKLTSVTTRDEIWYAKKTLKGTGITVSEFLTKGRHDVFLAARERFGVNRCWTRAGCVYVLDHRGTRHRVASMAELSNIEQDPEQKESTAGKPTSTATPSKTVRPKRAAAASKK